MKEDSTNPVTVPALDSPGLENTEVSCSPPDGGEEGIGRRSPLGEESSGLAAWEDGEDAALPCLLARPVAVPNVTRKQQCFCD